MFEKPEVGGMGNCLQHGDRRSAPGSPSPRGFQSSSSLTESICYVDRDQAKPLYKIIQSRESVESRSTSLDWLRLGCGMTLFHRTLLCHECFHEGFWRKSLKC